MDDSSCYLVSSARIAHRPPSIVHHLLPTAHCSLPTRPLQPPPALSVGMDAQQVAGRPGCRCVPLRRPAPRPVGIVPAWAFLVPSGTGHPGGMESHVQEDFVDETTYSIEPGRRG